jgi:hypothetical protein
VACELVSPEEIGGLIGRPVQSTLPTEDPNYCLWNTGSGSGIIGDVRVAVDPDPIDARGAIDRMIERGGTRIDGLGAYAAIELRRRPDFYKVMSQHGGVLVEVMVVGDPARLKDEQVVALARLVASRL